MNDQHTDGEDADLCVMHPFCDNEAEITYLTHSGGTRSECRDCYEEPCGRCFSEIEDDRNKPKRLCQDCRDEIQSWGCDEERGIEKDPTTEQTTLLTDGGAGPTMERQDGWPETYSAAGRAPDCPHQMHWDETDGVNRCVYDCDEIDEGPPEKYIGEVPAKVEAVDPELVAALDDGSEVWARPEAGQDERGVRA